MTDIPLHELEQRAHYWVPEEEDNEHPFMPYLFRDMREYNNAPVIDNFELITCKTCSNQSAVHSKENVSSYTCPTCYSVPKL